MQQSRRLVLVRHAEAEHAAATDLERVLTPAGRESAGGLGQQLAGAVPPPEHALVSAAVRARQTWDAVADAAAWALEPEVSSTLYGGEPETVLDLLRELAGTPSCVVLVGHNPTLASMAQMLDDGQGAPEVLDRLLTGGFPPCTAAVLEHDGGWADLAWAGARLVDYRRPV